MAVTVQKTPFVVLDEGDRIVGVGPDAESQFGPLVGSLIWDCFPGIGAPLQAVLRRCAAIGRTASSSFSSTTGTSHASARCPQSRRPARPLLGAARAPRHDDPGRPRADARRVARGAGRGARRRASQRAPTAPPSSSRVAHELTGRRRAATRRSGRVPRARRRRSDHPRVVAPPRRLRAAGSVTSSGSTCPAARDVYGPTFDEARTSGRPVESIVFYSGRVKRLTVIPGPDGLAVHVERLAEVDVTSLATLTASLAQIEAALAGRASAQHDSPARASLRALP